MQQFDDLHKWLRFKKNISVHKSIGLVPTMGNLHAGHASLIKRSVADNDLTVLTIFVNPTQFDNAGDLDKYPRTLSDDLALSASLGVDYVLTAGYNDWYPDHYAYQVQENKLSLLQEGAHRPGHFTGMLSMVMKLINAASANNAYFGEKDYQQLTLVRGMVEAFFMPVNIHACAIVRDEYGLALSSRNKRLSTNGLESARYFAAKLASELSCDSVIAKLKSREIEIGYIEEQNGRRFGAVIIEGVRLIDNVVVPT